MVGKWTRRAIAVGSLLMGVLLARAQNGAPVITSPTVADYGWYWSSGDVDPQYHYKIEATNSPTSFGATGLPAEASVDAQRGYVSGNAGKPGIYPVTVSATNASGTGTALITIRVHAAPEEGSLSGGTYRVGDTIYARVYFNAPVTVTGQPVLHGGVPFRYASGSGTVELTFTHVVTATDPAGEIFPSYTWTPGETAITDANGLTATSTIPHPRLQLSRTFIDPTATAPPVANPGRLVNLSVLALTGPGSQLLTVGFVTGGGPSGATQPLLLRGIGPSLATFGVPACAPDPALTLYRDQTAIGFNDNWAGVAATRAAMTATGAFALSDSSPDAAMTASLTPGPYTVQINAATAGNALAEIYDATPRASASTLRLVNVSCLSQLAPGGMLTCGFVITGSTACRVLIRTVGPALVAHGVANVLPDPTLTLYESLPNGSLLRGQNRGWAGDTFLAATFQAVGAFPFSNPASTDSAIVTTLLPGNYSVQARSATGASGTVLVEVYEAP